MSSRPATASRALGIAAAVVTTTAWGGQFVVGKSAFGHLDPVWLTALRYGIASLVFLALLGAVEGRSAFHPVAAWRRAAVLGVVGFAGFNLLAYVGLTETTPQVASLLVSTMPMVTAFVLWARTGSRPPAATWWFSALALVGVGLVLTDGHPASLLHGGLGRGHLLILGGVASWVVYTTGASGFPSWSPLRYTAVSAAFGSLGIVAIALASTAAGWLSLPTPADVGAVGWQLAYVSLVAAVVAVLCWNAATRTLGAQDAVLFINLVPVTAFVVEALRGHAPHPAEVAGAVVTLAALVAHNAWSRRTARTAVPAPVRVPAA